MSSSESLIQRLAERSVKLSHSSDDAEKISDSFIIYNWHSEALEFENDWHDNSSYLLLSAGTLQSSSF